MNAVLPDQRSSFSLAISTALLWLWIAYLLLAPTTGFSWIESWHNEQRAVQIVLLSLTAFVVATLLIAGPDAVRARLQLPWWWWAFIALGSTSALLSKMPFAAFAEVGFFVLLSALVLLTAALTSQRPEQMARVARYCAQLMALAHVLAVLVRFGASLHIGKGLDISVFMLGYANPRFASALYAVLMPFVAAVVVDPKERQALRGSAFITLCLLWTINLGLGTRGIWLAFAVGAPIAMALFGFRRTIRIIAAMGIAAAVGVALFMLLTAAPVADASTSGVSLPTERAQTLTSRDVLWSLAWKALAAHPLLGLGPMHFAALKSYVGAHPHNWPLQLAAEWGLPALALVLFALALAMVGQRRALRGGSAVNVEALIALSVVLVYGLVDGNLLMPVSQTAAALVLGLVIGSGRARSAAVPRRQGVAVIALLSTVATAVVVAFAMTSIRDQARTTAEFKATFPREWLVPRFWEQGLLWPETAPAAMR